MESALANGKLSYTDFKKVPVSGFVKGIQALGEGKVDITWISLGSGASRKVNTQMRKRGGFVYLSLDDSPEAVARMQKIAPPGSIRNVTDTKMPGIKEPTNIVQFDYTLFTHKDMDEETVYTITKGLATNKDHLASSFGAFQKNQSRYFRSTGYDALSSRCTESA